MKAPGVDLFDDPAWVNAAPITDPIQPRRATGVAVGAAILVGLVLGYLGWSLPVLGGSLVIPTLIVFAIGAVIAAGASILLLARPYRRDLRVFTLAVVAFTLVASVWTFQFSLAASVAWDSGATHQAQLALAQVSRGPKNANGVPLNPCLNISTGSIGPLNSPYRECAISTREGHFVLFSAIGVTPFRGLGYTDVGAATFPDECSKHLIGEWWMFVAFPNKGLGPCPIGYQAHGGP